MQDLVLKLAEKLQAELVQTHASWVLLIKDYVYKIKKPVNFGFLDYSTLAKRKFFCEQEVKLNRRLCKKIYLGVIPISIVNGKIRLGDTTNIVEYAVKMKRIPEEALLINRLDKATSELMKKIARRIYSFHTQAEIPKDFNHLEALRENVSENFEQTKPYIGKTIQRSHYNFIKEKTLSFLEKYGNLLEQRESTGFIRDGHGDIRCEHIALFSNNICIFDCIEFNKRFRYSDVINDMCFLSMELDYYGYPDLAKSYEQEYYRLSKDKNFYKFLYFYKSYRAYVRGKVTSFLLDDPHIKNKDKISENAKRFFVLAKQYIEKSQ